MSYREEAAKLQKIVHDTIRSNSVLHKADEATNGLNHAVLALEKLAIHMASIEYGETNPCDECGRKGLTAEQSGKTLAYIAKMVNEITRLLQFAKGEADQRTEVVGLEALLPILTNDQFSQVRQWIAEGEQRASQNLLQ